MKSVAVSSTTLSDSQVLKLLEAAEHAFWIKERLTRFITIEFKSAHIRQRPQDFIKAYLKLASDWLRTQDGPRSYIWVLENPPRRVLNAHILISVPSRLIVDFRGLERKWFKVAGGVSNRKAFVSKMVGKRGDTNGEYLFNLKKRVCYLLKGAAADTCAKLNINHAFQGYVRGQRMGLSRSLAPKAVLSHPIFGIIRPTSRGGVALRPRLLIEYEDRAQISGYSTVRYRDWLGARANQSP